MQRSGSADCEPSDVGVWRDALRPAAYLATRLRPEDAADTGGPVDVWFERDRERHELDGERPFNWGYGGGGPTNLAEAMLRHHLGAWPGYELHTGFVVEVVAEFHTAGFCYPVLEFDRWLREHSQECFEACGGIWNRQLVQAIYDALETSGERDPDETTWRWLKSFRQRAAKWTEAGWRRPEIATDLCDRYRIHSPDQAMELLFVMDGRDLDRLPQAGAPATRAMIAAYETLTLGRLP